MSKYLQMDYGLINWMPPDIIDATDAEERKILDKSLADDKKLIPGCEESKKCTGADKLNHVYAILLLIRNDGTIKTKQEFVDYFLDRLATVCTGNLKLDPILGAEASKIIAENPSQFCLESKYVQMLMDPSIMIEDALMMLPVKYLWAYSLTY